MQNLNQETEIQDIKTALSTYGQATRLKEIPHKLLGFWNSTRPENAFFAKRCDDSVYIILTKYGNNDDLKKYGLDSHSIDLNGKSYTIKIVSPREFYNLGNKNVTELCEFKSATPIKNSK